ncbi:MAG: SpoIIE family protein phosphatase [Clostridia bacterium]|nr:SpoIIE family protein phosphatase [Clostridia bacterium]
MAQSAMHEQRLNEEYEAASVEQKGFLGGIAGTMRVRGTLAQRVLCALLMALLTTAVLPGGGYACQTAMFAVLLRLGFCVPAAFAGVACGCLGGFLSGNMVMCWQMVCCLLLWLLCGVWVRRESRMTMALAVFAVQLSYGIFTGVDSVLAALQLSLTAVVGMGLCVLYDGAALAVRHQDELDGETRPLCLLAVCASVIVGLVRLPQGDILASALALYLTLEHAYVGGAPQALLCAGVVGGAAALGIGSVQPCAMLVCGGFLAGEIKTRHTSLCTLVMLSGMAAAGALLGGDLAAVRLFVMMLPGALPFLLLSSVRRSPVVGLIAHASSEEMTQSEAVAVRCASMIHAWARLYEDTAKMMQGLSAPLEDNPVVCQCVKLLAKTSTAAHQVCERTLSEIRPDDDAYRRVRYALLHAGLEQVRMAYALRMGGRMEVMLLKPESIAPVTLEKLVSSACGVPMRACLREDMLSTQAIFEQIPALSLEVGAAVRSRSGEEVTGDSYVSRALPGGRHVLALSDGMGSGVNAMQESRSALEMTVESLRAGYTRAQALSVVNALMLMCTGREMYATMDLCLIDLHSGEAAFEKLGACASYVVRSGEVRTVDAQTLPVGVLPDVEAASVQMTLECGDVVVMISDGVLESYPGGECALREAVAKLHWLHPQAVGERLIEQCLMQGGARDDMTVLCMRVGRAHRE